MTYPGLLAKATDIHGGDLAAAALLLTDITHVLDTETLTADQRRNLYKLRKKWQGRASGSDRRWNTFGSKPGNRNGTRKRVGDSLDPADPLVESIIRKFGTPIEEMS